MGGVDIVGQGLHYKIELRIIRLKTFPLYEIRLM